LDASGVKEKGKTELERGNRQEHQIQGVERDVMRGPRSEDGEERYELYIHKTKSLQFFTSFKLNFEPSLPLYMKR